VIQNFGRGNRLKTVRTTELVGSRSLLVCRSVRADRVEQATACSLASLLCAARAEASTCAREQGVTAGTATPGHPHA